MATTDEMIEKLGLEGEDAFEERIWRGALSVLGKILLVEIIIGILMVVFVSGLGIWGFIIGGGIGIFASLYIIYLIIKQSVTITLDVLDE